jgi:diacylglycerol kinase family enzyme
VRLDVDGRQLVRRTPVVFVGNNRYKVSGLDIGSRDSLEEGVLCVYAVRKAGRLRLLRLGLRALMGRLERSGELDMLLVRELTIDTRRRALRVACDGEALVMTPPLHYRIRPRDLRVIVPEDE